MKLIAAIFLLLNFLTFASCQKTEVKSEIKPIETPQTKSGSNLNTKSLTKLFELLKSKNIKDIEIKADEIRAGNSKIKVSTTVEHDVFNQDRWIFAARYETRLIDAGETLFTVGSVGIGSDKNDAEETSIDEWIGLFGTAFAEMLAKSNDLKIGGFDIYAGAMGIRGEKPAESWIDGSSAMNKKIIGALLPLIKKSNREITSLNLMLTVNQAGEIEGECRINNEVSAGLLAELKKLDWTKSQTLYMFKQFYLLRKSAEK